MAGLTITEDRLLGGQLLVRQYKEAYRIAIDPVLLAASVAARPQDHVLDLGCGVGAASLCLAKRLPRLKITGLEKERAFADLARQNVELNGLGDYIGIEEGDLLHWRGSKYDWVIANPPYLAKGKASPSPNKLKTAANMEGDADLCDWVKAADIAVKEGGSIAFIHRWDRLPELLEAVAGIGSAKILPLVPKIGAAPHRLLIQVRKNARLESETLPAFPLHTGDGAYTEEAENILRGGAALDLT